MLHDDDVIRHSIGKLAKKSYKAHVLHRVIGNGYIYQKSPPVAT